MLEFLRGFLFEGIVEFVYWYPALMAMMWVVGSLIFYFNNEKREALPLKETPMVSILMPAHNEGDILYNVVKEMTQLNYPNYELIMINDGSSDDTGEVLKKIVAMYDNVRVIDLKKSVYELVSEHPEAAGRIHVVNTYLASTPMHLLVHEACRKRDEGLSAAQIADWAREARWSAQTLFMVDNLASLHRGGRVPKTVAVAGDKLNVKPLLTFSLTGELGIVGVARGRKKGLAKLVDYFRRGCAKDGGNLVVAIGDADAREDGNALAERIKEQFPGARTLRSTIGPTIGCHVGPGMVSCCFWGEDRRSA